MVLLVIVDSLKYNTSNIHFNKMVFIMNNVDAITKYQRNLSSLGLQFWRITLWIRDKCLYRVSERLESLNEEITWTCSIIPQNTTKAKFWNSQIFFGKVTQAVNLHLHM